MKGAIIGDIIGARYKSDNTSGHGLELFESKRLSMLKKMFNFAGQTAKQKPRSGVTSGGKRKT